MVPTILFTPQNGAETAVDGHGYKMSQPEIQLIFWGSEWLNGFSFSPAMTADVQAAKNIVNSTYFDAVSQYVGGPPNVSFATPFVDTTSEPPAGQYTDTTLAPLLVGEIQHAIDMRWVGGPSGYGSSTPIYVVVTPSSVSDTDANGFAVNGFNGPNWIYSDANGGATLLPTVWDGQGWDSDADGFSLVLGHEVAEAMTDPYGNSSGVQIANPSSSTSAQIADNEAAEPHLPPRHTLGHTRSVALVAG